MTHSTPLTRHSNTRALTACVLSFTILITPIAAIAAPSMARASIVKEGNEKKRNKVKSAAEELFVNPPSAIAAPALPGPQPEPAPQPLAPPVGSVTAGMTGVVVPTANNADLKADPGDTINYTVTLGNTSGADATGLSFNDSIDSHTAFVPSSIKSSPVCFDQSVTTNEDVAKAITLTGQDPDGDTITFSIVSGPSHGSFGGTTAPNLTYTPAADFNGSDSFTFRVNDGTTSGAGANGNSNETCTVSVTVNAVNDPPSFTVPGNPTAVNEDAGAQSVSSFITNVTPGPANESSQTVSFVITNNTNPSLFSSGPSLNVAAPSGPFPTTATLTYTSAANQNGTALITYHAHDNGGTANGGVDNSANQTFTITVNAVNDPPVVVAPTGLTAQANMKVTGLTGLLANVNDNADNGVNGCVSTTFTVTSGSISATTPAGGTISNVNLSTGTFDFDPPPGVTGDVTFTYTVSDTGCGSGTPGISSPATTVHVAVSGPVIWFVNLGAGVNGDGRLSSPFNSLASANTKLQSLAANQRIFLYTTGATPASAAVGDVVTLQGSGTQAAAHWLVGQGAIDAGGFDTLMGITPPSGTIARPTINGVRPIVRGTVTMKDNTVVQGLNIDVSAGATKGLTSGSGIAAGSVITIKDVNVTSASGNAVDFSSAQTISYTTSNSSTSPNILSSTTGTALSVVNTTIGAGGLTFKSITAGTAGSGPTNGIILNNTGSSGGLTVTGTGTTAGSGGTIQKTVQGALFTSTSNLTLKNMNFTNADSGSGTGNNIDNSTFNSSSQAAINMSSVSTVTFDNLSMTNPAGAGAGNGINGQTVSNFTLSNTTVDKFGDNVNENDLRFFNLTGTCAFTNDTISLAAENAVDIRNNTGTLTLTVQGSPLGTNFTTFNDTQSSVNGGALLAVTATSNSTINLTVKSSKFLKMKTVGIQTIARMTSTMNVDIVGGGVNANGNQFDPQGGLGRSVDFSAQDTAHLNFNLNNNPKMYGNGGPTINVFGINNAVIQGRMNNNPDIRAGGNGAAGSAIFLHPEDNSTGTIEVLSNAISGVGNDAGISALSHGDGGANHSATLDVTLHSNTIVIASTSPGGVPGIDTRAGSNAGDTIKTCVDVMNNAVTLGSGGSDVGWLTREGSSTAGDNLYLEGMVAGASNTARAVNTWNGRTNTPSGSAIAVDAGGAAAYTAPPAGAPYNGVCRTPSNPSAMYRPETNQRDYFARTGDVFVEGSSNASSLLAFLNTRNDVASIFENFNHAATLVAPNSVEVKPTLLAAAAAITGESSKNSASLSQWLGALAGSVARFANRVDSLIVPTAAAAVPPDVRRVSDLPTDRSLSSTGLRPEARRQEAGARKQEEGGSKQQAGGSGQQSRVQPQSGAMFIARAAKNDRQLRRSEMLSSSETNVALLRSAGNNLGRRFYKYDIPTGLRQNHSKSQRTKGPTKVGTLNVRLAARSRALAPMLVGGTFPINGTGSGFTLPNGKTITITFSVTLNNPPNLTGVPPAAPQVFNHGNLSGTNVSGFDTNTVTTNVDLFDSTTTVTSLPNPSNTSQSVTFTAAIGTTGSPSGSGTNRTGTVNFKDGGVTIPGCGTQPVSSNQATCTTSGLSTATHTITAVYSGDGNFDPSNGTLSGGQVVNQSGTTTTVTSSLNPSLVSQNVTFTATVASSTSVPGPPTGTVQFKDNGVNLGSPQTLNGSGVATFSTTSLTAGSHTPITAVYSGDTNFTTSTGTLSAAAGQNGDPQVVNKSNTTTALASSQNPSAPTVQVTYTATVSSSTSVTGPPTGTVTFKDGVNTITCENVGGQTLNGSGVATCQFTYPTTTGSPHSITATYNGDGTFNTSTSNTVVQVVQSCSSSVVVTSNADSGPNTLREAIDTGVCDGGTITFDPAVTSITLVTELLIAKNLTITGPGAGSLTISGNNVTRVFEVNPAKTVNISGMTITGGQVVGTAGGAGLPGGAASGGGIFNAGTLTLTNVIVSGSHVTGGDGGAGSGVAGGAGGNASGGGIFNNGTLTLTNSTVNVSNSATGGKGGNSDTTNGNGGAGFGGGIYTLGALTLTLTNSTVAGNTAAGGAAGVGAGAAGSVGSGSGGGIYNDGTSVAATARITNSTISGNTASLNGGGIANVGALTNATLTISNSTISGNNANNNGGGIYNDGATGTTTLTSVTVTNNTSDNDNNAAGTGGGLNVVSGTVTLKNTIVAGNFNKSTGPTADDIAGSVDTSSASSFNLIGTGGAGGLVNATNSNQVGVADAKLGALANNGGPTQTHALLDMSPALDAGINSPLTTLNGGIDNATTTVVVTDASNIPGGASFTILVDTEQMVVISKASNTLTVTRGANGTSAASHLTGASVYPAGDQRGFRRTVNFDGNPPAGTGDDTDIGAFERQTTPATITKAFSPTSIQAGGTTTVTLTLGNTNALDLTNASFTDTLVSMSAVGGAVGGTCVGTTPNTLAANDTALSFSGITIPSGGSCTVTFDVKSSAPGTNPNATSGVTTTQTSTTGAASNTANLTVLAPPTIAKAFSPTTIQSGGSSTVTLTLSNSNASPLTNASLTDTLVNMSAVGGAVGGTCVGTLPNTLAPNDTALSFSGITIPAGGSCTVTFDVKSSTAGTNPNATSGVTTTQTTTPGAVSNTANLTVLAPATIAKAFSPTSIQSGGTSTVTLTLSNTNASPLTNASFTDTLANMSAVGGVVGGTCAGTTPNTLVANATALSFSGITIPASGSCTVTFAVTSSTVGTNPNATSGVTTTQTTIGTSSNTANLTVFAPPTIAKAFGPDKIQTGGSSTVTLTLSNTNTADLTNASFTDTLTNMSAVGGNVTGICVGTTPNTLAANATALSFSGITIPASGSCTVIFDVKSSTPGTNPNTTSGVTTTQTTTAGTASNTANLSVFAPPTVLSITRADANPTNLQTVHFTVTFSKPVTGVDITDFTTTTGGGLSGASVTGVTPVDSSHYTVTVDTGTGDGTLRLNVVDDDSIQSTDALVLPLGGTGAVNGNFSAGEVYTVSKSDPFVSSITRADASPTNAASVHFTVTFTKPVTGVNIGANSDFALTTTGTIAGASITGLSGSGTTYTVTVNTGTGSGTIRLDVTDDDTIVDSGSRPLGGTGLGNGNFTTGEVYAIDKTPPNVTINQKTDPPAQADPVTGPSASTIINFTAIFTKPVTGFTASGVNISGTANATVANVTEIAPNDGTHFNVGIEGMTQSGTVIADIAAGVATDNAGNLNTASTSSDHTVTYFKDDFTSFVVNTTADTDDGHCDPLGTGTGNMDCTLREAINAANADAGPETITFAPALTAGGPATISLLTALPNITTDMTIQGPGANLLTVERNSGAGTNFRIFNIASGTVIISGLTITKGLLGISGQGGGVFNAGTLTLNDDALSINQIGASGLGGGVYNNGTLTINRSTINGNQVGNSGSGGGIYNPGTMTINNSTISGNLTGSSGQGGGIFGLTNTLTINSSTITLNQTGSSSSGGGIFRSSGTVTLKNTIVGGGNTAATAPDISGTVNSEGFNLIQSTSGATINQTLNAGTNITGQDPQLFPLADNGGGTITHAVRCVSPAIDKGYSFGLTTDQRGRTRPFDLADSVYPNAAPPGDGSDIGAFETQTGGGCIPTAVPPSVQSTNEDTLVAITLTGTYSQNTALSFTITQQPTHSTAALTPSAPSCTNTAPNTCTATVNYTPSADYFGPDFFKFKVSAGALDSEEADVNITVISVNDPPVANNDSLSSVPENSGTRTIPFADLLANDSVGPANESGQTLTISAVGSPSGGTVSISGTDVLFTPTTNFHGTASFKYTARDNGTTNGLPDPKDSVTQATVSFTVVAPPSITKTFGGPIVPLNGTISLTFGITNPNSSTVLTGIGFNDTFPSGLVLDTPSGLSGSCGGGIITAADGSGSVSLSGASLAALANCTFSVKIKGTSVGVKNNTTDQVTSNEGGKGNTAVASVTVVAPDMTVSKTHVGNFTQGDTGDTYTITITNSGNVPTTDTVTVTDTVPTGLTPTGPAGAVNGWACSIVSQTLVCTRGDVLAGGASYPPITLTVNVANPAPLSVINKVTVAGGGEVNTSNNTANDPTTINCTQDFSLNNTSPLVISRFRENGPNGPTDEFVEIFNPANTTHTVASGSCTGGYGVYATAGNGTTSNAVSLVCQIPNGTKIPAGGYYLCTGAGYSLGNLGRNGGSAGATAAGDAPIGCDGSCTADIPNDAGLALINVAGGVVATPTGFNAGIPDSATIVFDKVGFAPYGAGAPAPAYPSPAGNFCEGSCLQPVGDASTAGLCTNPTGLFPVISAPPACYGQSGQYELLRRQTAFDPGLGTLHRDTNNNADDFLLVSPNPGVNIGANVTGISGVTSVLGAAGPYNSSAPPDIPSTTFTQAPFDGPNQLGQRNAEREYSQDPFVSNTANDPRGTFTLRFRFTNNSSTNNITGLRIEVDNLATLCGLQTATPGVGSGAARNLSATPNCGSGSFTAILKVLNSATEIVVDGGGTAQTVNGTVLEDLSVAGPGPVPAPGALSPLGGGVDNTLIVNPSSAGASTGDGVTGGTGQFATTVGTTSTTKVLRLKIKFGVVRSGRFVLLLTPEASTAPTP